MLLALPLHGSAQTSGGTGDHFGTEHSWDSEVGYAAANALLSGLITGIFRSASGDGSFGEGFETGALGGLVTYGGKRLAARRFSGAGFLGRQVASLGGSMVSNARDGRGTLDRITFQLGLGRLYWDRVGSRVRFRPDVPTLYYTTLGITRSGVELDWSRTLSSGAPVFVTEPGATALDGNAAGRTLGGIILMDANASLGLSDIAAHERVHVLQYDQQFALWAEAAEGGLAALFGEDVASLVGRVDLGIGLVPVAPLLYYLPRDANPLEREAAFLTGDLGPER